VELGISRHHAVTLVEKCIIPGCAGSPRQWLVIQQSITLSAYVGQSSTVDLDSNPADISHAARIQYFFSS